MSSPLPPDSSTVARTLEAAMQLMQNTLAELTQLRVQFAELNPRMKDIAWLVKVVRDGNGEDSIMTRLRLIETKLVDLPGDQETLVNHVDSVLRDLTKRIEGFERDAANNRAAREKFAIEDRKGSWQLKVAIVTGIISFLGIVGHTIAAFVGR